MKWISGRIHATSYSIHNVQMLYFMYITFHTIFTMFIFCVYYIVLIQCNTVFTRGFPYHGLTMAFPWSCLFTKLEHDPTSAMCICNHNADTGKIIQSLSGDKNKKCDVFIASNRIKVSLRQGGTKCGNRRTRFLDQWLHFLYLCFYLILYLYLNVVFPLFESRVQFFPDIRVRCWSRMQSSV